MPPRLSTLSGTGDGAGSSSTRRLDPRVARTRRLLQDALLSLAREHSLDDVTVADVADRATVNRSTFYQHYADVDTLLADALDAVAARTGADLSTLRPDADLVHPSPELVSYFRHIAEYDDVYRRVLGAHGSSVAVARLRTRMTQLASAGLQVHGVPTSVAHLPCDVAAGSISGSLIGIIIAWLERDPLPTPDEAAGWAWSALTAWSDER